ncbi:putative PurR-regulated permease PerM [Dyella sp. SG562]|uniref:AI-2E family transporter n=1 Tax=Dyella TaxID=231454 RepID=UPI00142407F6|nr:MULTISPECIES: AI-2E family transporter [unclassified Dyella]NII72205.1 putative PurR-regulated permease PerM [Dyella sp. SG562]NKJ22593.1 putative PurR-regulated permease PerM [Dyella sp. SG609]
MSAIGPLVPPPEGSGEMAPAPLPPADEPPARHRHRPAVRFTQRHLLGIRAVLNLLLLLALLYTVTLARDLLIPLVLAGFIGLAFNPIVAFAARRRVPRWLSASFLVIALIAGIGNGIARLTPPALEWFHDAPSLVRNFVPKLRTIMQPLEAANRATQSLVGGQLSRPPPRAAPVTIDAWDVLAGTPKVLAAVLTVVLLVFFFLIYGDTLLRRLVEIAPNFRYKRRTVSIVRSIQVEVSRYILTTVVINATLGVVTATMLWAYAVPDPLLWGSVAMIANFIPYVGSITTTALLAVVGLIHFDQPGQALLPALTFAGITAVEGNLITPLIQGRRMRLSPVAILLWLLVWGWLWGIPGALLAVPMLTSVKLIAEKIRGWRWFAMVVQR